jgi:hypothetical protein
MSPERFVKGESERTSVFIRQQQNGTERGGEPMLILGDNKGLDTSLIVPPLWRSLGVTLWQF